MYYSALTVVWPGPLVFTVVVPLTSGDSVPGRGCDDPGDTVSMDVWLVVVLWVGGLGCVSFVPLGGCGEFEGGGDDDAFSGVTAELFWCVAGGGVLLVVTTEDKLTSFFFVTVKGGDCAEVVVVTWFAAGEGMVTATRQTTWKGYYALDQSQLAFLCRMKCLQALFA